MTAHFDRNIIFVPSLTYTPLEIFIASPKILMTFFLVIDLKSSYFPYFFPTFHNKAPYFSLHFCISSLTNSDDFFSLRQIRLFFTFSTPSPFIPHCKNSLS